MIDNTKIINRRVIANEFNKYFISIAAKLNEPYLQTPSISSTDPCLKSFEEYLSPPCTSSIYLHDCDTDEITQIISELKNGKSSDIPVIVIKRTALVIAPYLVEIYNQCLKTGTFPTELKTGRITPIYKKDNEQLIENYRPVSTLPIFGKILEKIIYSRLYSFFISKGHIYENQFGFRKGHSTSHALNYSVSHIESELKNKKHILGIFIDLSKAFDTLDHNILLNKLSNYGVRGNALDLLSSYLSDREQYVSILGEKSDKLQVEFGVPQGSVLGPLLFLIYINDICSLNASAMFILFADDTNIFVSGDNKRLVYEKANQILRDILQYMKSNLLHINAKKCCYMYFPPSKTHDNNDQNIHYLKLEDTVLSQVNETKFLGVIIDDKLNWTPHISKLNSKLRSTCGRIYRIKNSLPDKLYKQIYHSLFESHLSYGISVWGGVCKTRLDKLFITQKKCLRILFGDTQKFLDKSRTCARSRGFGNENLDSEHFKLESTKPLFQKHSILALRNLYRYRCIIETYKILKYRVPISMYSLYNRSNRKSTMLITPTPTHNFLYKSSSLWNELIKALNIENFEISICSLKRRTKTALMTVQGSMGVSWYDENFIKWTLVAS